MGNFARSVSIIGVGYTPLGDVRYTEGIKDFTERELYAAASLEAMENAGIKAKDIDAYYVGMVAPNYWSKTMSAAPHMAEWVGMRHKPTLFHEEGCATSLIGFEQAVMAVASGKYDCVLSGAATIVQSEPKKYLYPPFQREAYDPYDWWQKVATGNELAYEKIGGEISPAIDASVVKYCRDNNVSFEEISEACANYMQVQRRHALSNPRAALVTETYEEEAARFGFDNVNDYILSDVYDPRTGTILRPNMAGRFVDAGSAVIVCATELASKLSDKQPIEVAAITASSTTSRHYGLYPTPAYMNQFKELYEQAGVDDPVHTVDYFSAHDCPVTQIFMCGEYAGYFPKGEGWKYMRDGRTAFDQDRPCQTSGGRTQLGHPASAAITVEITEAVNQMRGENGARQMPTPPKFSVIEGGGQGINLACCALRTL